MTQKSIEALCIVCVCVCVCVYICRRGMSKNKK